MNGSKTKEPQQTIEPSSKCILMCIFDVPCERIACEWLRMFARVYVWFVRVFVCVHCTLCISVCWISERKKREQTQRHSRRLEGPSMWPFVCVFVFVYVFVLSDYYCVVFIAVVLLFFFFFCYFRWPLSFTYAQIAQIAHRVIKLNWKRSQWQQP